MIDVNINYNSYQKDAEGLFYPFFAKICCSKLKLQNLIALIREIIFFIPKTCQRKYFIEDFIKKFNLISAAEENLQASDLDNPRLILDLCENKLKQLNCLYSVHLLIKNYYGHTIQSKTEIIINKLIIKNKKLINDCINEIERGKINSKIIFSEDCLKSQKKEIENVDDIVNDKTIESITKPIQLCQEKVENDSLIPINEQEKIVETDSSFELFEKSETSQTLQPSTIEINNRDTHIEIHQPSETPPLESENLWGKAKKWTGIRGLQTGVKNVQNGNYLRGFCEIAFGSVRIALTAYATFFVAQQIIGSFNKIPHPLEDKYKGLGGEPEYLESHEVPYIDRFERAIEIPGVEKSQVQSETFNTVIGSRKITLITAYDEGIKDYAQHVIPNQRAFAAKHGYDYIEYYGNLAHDQGRQRAPYWSKIVAIYDQLQKTKEGEWIAWGDASALFTNTKKNFDQIIEKHGVDKDIILTTDPQVPINNAVFLVKNTLWTKNWIKQVWARSDLAKGGEGNCWSWGQPFCHYEQQAMTELWQRDSDVQSHTAVISNKEMNAFYRYSHYDSYRNMHQNYDGDPESSKWTPGDFICKVTGMDRDRRLGIIQHVANNCIDQNCDRIQF